MRLTYLCTDDYGNRGATIRCRFHSHSYIKIVSSGVVNSINAYFHTITQKRGSNPTHQSGELILNRPAFLRLSWCPLLLRERFFLLHQEGP